MGPDTCPLGLDPPNHAAARPASLRPAAAPTGNPPYTGVQYEPSLILNFSAVADEKEQTRPVPATQNV